MIGEDLFEIGEAIAVRVGVVRIGSDQYLKPIGKAIAIAVCERVKNSTAGVRACASFPASICGP
jgi:hypothetical protein